MKLFRTIAIALTFTLAAGTAFAKGDAKAGSGSASGGGSAALTDADKADINAFLAYFDKVVDAVVADEKDCAKMAKDINALADANKDLIEKANKAIAAGKKLPDDAQKHIMQSAQKMSPGLMACQKNQDVMNALMHAMPGNKPAPKATK